MNKIEPYPTVAAEGMAMAAASALLELGSGLRAFIQRRAERRRERIGLCELQSLSDHLLQDIGLSRHDMAFACTVPQRNSA